MRPASYERVVEAFEAADVKADPLSIIREATSVDALRRLGEMRLLALSEHGDVGVLGITRAGRRVILGLLYALHAGMRFDKDGVREALLDTSSLVSNLVAFDDLPPDVVAELERFAAEEAMQ